MEPIKIGIGGPVGAGKTQLVERLTRHLSGGISMAAITNDIYTIEDAKILAANGILPVDRIIGIETGGCPHTAIREDTSMNSAAVEELRRRHPGLEVVFIESGETTSRRRSARNSSTSRYTSSTSPRGRRSRARRARA